MTTSQYTNPMETTATSRAETEALINAALPVDRRVVFDRAPETGTIRPWGGVPVQAEGTLGGERFYFRFRMNRAALTVYAPSPDGTDGEPITTASVDNVVPGEDYAGVFDSGADMAECFQRLVAAQAPVHPLDNPTTVQRMESGILGIELARAEGLLAAEETVFTSRPDSEVAAAAYPNWLALPEVAAWVADGRPADGRR